MIPPAEPLPRPSFSFLNLLSLRYFLFFHCSIITLFLITNKKSSPSSSSLTLK
jgi:hypothetical protein